MNEETFASRWESDHANFLMHLMQKHKGEVISLESEVRQPPAPIPNCLAMFHPELYVETGTEQARRIRKLSSSLVEPSRGPCRLDEEEFLRMAASIPNSVFTPIPGTNSCQQVFHKYQTLPGLIFEMMGEADLLEIYTFFCTAPLLVRAKPHSRCQGLQREAQVHGKKNHGRYGHRD